MKRFMQIALLLVVGFFLGCGAQKEAQFQKAAAPKSSRPGRCRAG